MANNKQNISPVRHASVAFARNICGHHYHDTDLDLYEVNKGSHLGELTANNFKAGADWQKERQKKVLSDLMSLMQLDCVVETDIEFNERQGLFTVLCQNGLAKCIDNDEIVVVDYPKIEDLTPEQKDEIVQYRGLTLGESDINYGDIMIVLGKIIITWNINSLEKHKRTHDGRE